MPAANIGIANLPIGRQVVGLDIGTISSGNSVVLRFWARRINPHLFASINFGSG